MYKNFFGLRENPFNVNPNPRFLVQTREIEETLACLTYGIRRRKGFVLLTGEVGTGKTTLLNKLLECLHSDRVASAFIFNPQLSVGEFLDFMMADFGINNETALKSEVLLRLNQWLLERYRVGENVVLIIDEAQNLSLELLEEIRLLTNLETEADKLLQIVLSGQPELERKLNQPQLRQLRQRITLRCKTAPLTSEQTHGYIIERLRIAGANGKTIFTSEGLEAVYRYSRGIPRVINLLCEHALITAFAEQQKPISAGTVEEVAREFATEFLTAPSPKGGERQEPQGAESLRQLGGLMDRMRQAE